MAGKLVGVWVAWLAVEKGARMAVMMAAALAAKWVDLLVGRLVVHLAATKVVVMVDWMVKVTVDD